MNISDFDYSLPEDLIANYPAAQRTHSRLMVVSNTGDITHEHFYDLPHYLNKNDLLVFNNTRVIPARIFGYRPSGGKIEILIERITSNKTALAHVRANKKLKSGAELCLDQQHSVFVCGRDNDLFELVYRGEGDFLNVIEALGHMPLPPYIDREDDASDHARYQTVYAKEKGAVAAPTAGLHFDEGLLQKIEALGVQKAFVTLHVGAGTFQPVRVDNIQDHIMHSEWVDVPSETVQAIRECKARGGRVIAVGTTSLRSLEAASQGGEIHDFSGDTDIFIYPGCSFHCVDALITNFHLPKSTLLMLVSAFSGLGTIKKAYQTAIQKRYRFFSYGDAMFLQRLYSNQSSLAKL